MDEQSKKPHNHERAETAAVGQIRKTAGLISRQKDDQEKGHFQYGDDDEKLRKGRWILGLVIAFAGFAFRQGYIDQLQVRHYSPLLELRLPQNQGMGVMITLLACLLVTAASFRQKLGACSKADHQGEKSTTADVVGFAPSETGKSICDAIQVWEAAEEAEEGFQAKTQQVTYNDHAKTTKYAKTTK
ncbi:hypothetical protein THAOC_05004 [Thalassiosira oceanica]|uniref:Uncharacterized protein n=1 Tax=Thalassiosira oceanica TaxID=159749 RepID=K0T6T0_THAOC|nr:hypothetical protein THAOC_05004 [Thalassiosira oceanica]|eukprot:EJK73375.1 hypothetical protein THAOC_05004 [Thalassiosira oceanica]